MSQPSQDQTGLPEFGEPVDEVAARVDVATGRPAGFRPNDLGLALELSRPIERDDEAIVRGLKDIALWARDQARVATEGGLELTGMELIAGADSIDRFAEEVDAL